MQPVWQSCTCPSQKGAASIPASNTNSCSPILIITDWDILKPSSLLVRVESCTGTNKRSQLFSGRYVQGKSVPFNSHSVLLSVLCSSKGQTSGTCHTEPAGSGLTDTMLACISHSSNNRELTADTLLHHLVCAAYRHRHIHTVGENEWRNDEWIDQCTDLLHE